MHDTRPCQLDVKMLDVVHNNNWNSKVEWIAGSPFSISALLRQLYFVGGDGGCARRLKRSFLFLLVPFVAFGPYLGYYSERKMWYVERHASLGSPLGLLALLVNFHEALINWRYFLGGPHIIIVLTLVIGLAFLCAPFSMSLLLTADLIKPENSEPRNNSPVLMNIIDLARYSSTNITQRSGFQLLLTYFSSRFTAMLNLRFWQHCYYIWIHQLCKLFRNLVNFFENRCLKAVTLCFVPLVLLLKTFLILCELVAIVLHNGVPLLSFMCLLYTRYFRFIRDTIRQCSPIIRNGLALVCLVVLVYVSYGYTLLLVRSFTLVSLLFNFTLVGVISNSSVLLIYVLLSTVILIYAWKSVSGMLEDYEFIFIIITDATIRIQNRLNQSRNVTATSPVDFERSEPYSNLIDHVMAGYNTDYVKEIRGLPAIHKDLFYQVVERHKPLRNNIAKAILKFLITCLVIIMIITIVFSFNRENLIGEILQLLGVVLTGLLPLILRVFKSPYAHVRSAKEFEHLISCTVEDYITRDIRRSLNI